MNSLTPKSLFLLQRTHFFEGGSQIPSSVDAKARYSRLAIVYFPRTSQNSKHTASKYFEVTVATTDHLLPISCLQLERVAAILLLCKSAHVYCSALFTKFLQAQLKILFFIKPYLTRQANMLGSFTGLLNLEPFSILCLCPCLAFSTPHVSVPCQWDIQLL